MQLQKERKKSQCNEQGEIAREKKGEGSWNQPTSIIQPRWKRFGSR